MKRGAFLFGNTDGLKGVKKDICSFKDFLMSDVGGAWKSNEILDLCDLSLDSVAKFIGKVRKEAFDYFVIYFSGHGGMKRTTFLEINPIGEQINEDELGGIAKRQLMIFDCCRCLPAVVANTKVAVFDESVESNTRKQSLYRARYDHLIMSAPEQEIRLYSCQPDCYSYDTNVGGVYTQRLIDNAIEGSKGRDVLCEQNHKEVAEMMLADYLGGEIQRQYPDKQILNRFPDARGLVFALQEIC